MSYVCSDFYDKKANLREITACSSKVPKIGLRSLYSVSGTESL